jgi:hypothetical protein
MAQGFLVKGSGGHLGLQQVIFASVIEVVGGTAIFAMVALLTRRRRPILAFRIVAAVVLAPSLSTPPTIPGAPVLMVLTLEMMHVVAAVIIVGFITTLACAR